MPSFQDSAELCMLSADIVPGAKRSTSSLVGSSPHLSGLQLDLCHPGNSSIHT